jgi:hypothetical protein
LKTDNIKLAGEAAEKLNGNTREIFPLQTHQESDESMYGYIRRLVFYHILPKKPILTISELIETIEKITHEKVYKAFLLVSIIFEDSGLMLDGDVLTYTIFSNEQVVKIRYQAKKFIGKAGGKIEEEELLKKITDYFSNKGLDLKNMPLVNCLFHNRSKFHCTVEGEQRMISHSYSNFIR